MYIMMRRRKVGNLQLLLLRLKSVLFRFMNGDNYPLENSGDSVIINVGSVLRISELIASPIT